MIQEKLESNPQTENNMDDEFEEFDNVSKIISRARRHSHGAQEPQGHAFLER